MKFESFLENLYLGNMDSERFTYTESHPDDPVVKKVVTQFKEISKEYPPAELEKLGRVPDTLLDRLREIGFFGLLIPKEYGGLGMNMFQYVSTIEQLIGHDMGLGLIAMAHLSIGVKGLLLYGTDAQKKKYLPQASAGTMIFCYALTEPLIGSDAKNITTIAELSDDGSHYILNGTKTFITNANYAGGLTVFAQLDREKPGKLGAFIVETAWEGVSIGKDMEKLGLKVSSTASIQFKNVRVPKENMIGAPGDGFKIAMTILNYGRLGLGAASAGMLAVSRDDMLHRALTRIQFGTHIINFELIQEKIIKAVVNREIVTAMTNFTAGLLADNPIAQVAIESSHCKLYGTNTAWETLYDAMQVSGGAGYLSSQPYEKRMRDFRVATIFEGTSEIHSIYPPLSFARTFSRMLKGKAPNILTRMIVMAWLYIKPSPWRYSSQSRAVARSMREIKRGAKLFRRLFFSSIRRWGADIEKREYLLRRLTVISYYVYGLLALAARTEYLRKAGADTAQIEAVLEYFTHEASVECRKNYRVNPDKTELLRRNIFTVLKSHFS